MKIKDVEIEHPVMLAPLAGVSDQAFRLMAKREGASMVFSEMVSADGLVRNSLKTKAYMRFSPEERPLGIQLFGSNPEIMAEAALIVEKLSPDIIDLNFGCPVRKVVKRGAGAALLKDLPLMREIVRSVVSAVTIPVSGKIRSGWAQSEPTAVESSRILEEEGACWITIHPRTQKMGFTGKADWDVIRKIKETVSVPVIGSGDVLTPEDVRRMLDETGCDAVMIGRGALGRPWIFRQVNHFLKTGDKLPDPGFSERIDYCLKHYHLAIQFMEKERCVKEMRKQVGWYLKGMPGSGHVRQEIFLLKSRGEVEKRLVRYQKELNEFLV